MQAALETVSKSSHTGDMTAPQEPSSSATNSEALGGYLKSTRRALGMTLRGVETATQKSVTNGYLSQIEGGDVRQPSPRILHRLAEAYGIEYNDLMSRAGYLVESTSTAPQSGASINGFPLRALDDLNAEETKAVLEYLEFIKSKR